MSWDAMEWAHLQRAKLKPTEKLTLIAMAFHASRDGGGVFASGALAPSSPADGGSRL